MKKIVSIKFMVVLLMVLVPLLMNASGQLTYTATYADMPTIGTRSVGGVTYTTVKYGDLYNIGEPGKPSLPVDYISFSVPCNATNFSVTATPVMGNPIALDYPVIPIQSNTNQTTIPDDSTYNSDVYPENIAWFVDKGILAGENQVVTVAVMPLCCNHTNGAVLQVLESVHLTLNYELSDSPIVYPITRKGASLREKGYELVEGLVVNPLDIRTNAFSSHSRSFPFVNDSVDDPSTYIIITTPELKHSVRRIAALNQQKGINVKVVTVDEALNDTITEDGDYYRWGESYHLIYGDDAGKLRSYLKGCYSERGCEYVLLAGTDVPYRYSDGGQADMYFSELNANWKNLISEGDRRFGELYVGRLLGSEPEQIDNYTDKLLRYELNPGYGDYSYLSRALFSECEEYGEMGYPFRDEIHEIIPDTVVMREIPNQNYPTAQAFLDSIGNNHYGLVSFVNESVPSHILLYKGDEINEPHYLWALSEVKDYPGIVDIETDNGLNHMNNKYHPMIAYCPLGNTMSYDCKEMFDLDVNLGESFTMGKDYGGPAFIGMTYPYYSNSFNWNYGFDIFSGDFGGKIHTYNGWLVKALLGAKASYPLDDWQITNSGYNYLGDPALNMWIETPQVYSNISVNRTDNTIVVSGLPANQAYLAYHSNDGATGKVAAVSSTVTLNNVSPNSTIMLYGLNRIPYIAPLVLQNTTLNQSQYVIADEVLAGKAVDNGRTRGDVTVSNGTEFEIEASGKVTLTGGFNVERGALFSVLKSTYK